MVAIGGMSRIGEAGARLAVRSETRVVVADRDEPAAEEVSAAARRRALRSSRPAVDGSFGRCLMNGKPRGAQYGPRQR